MYVCMYVCMYSWIWDWNVYYIICNKPMYVCMYVSLMTCVHNLDQTFKCMCMYVCMYVWIYALYVCIYVLSLQLEHHRSGCKVPIPYYNVQHKNVCNLCAVCMYVCMCGNCRSKATVVAVKCNKCAATKRLPCKSSLGGVPIPRCAGEVRWHTNIYIHTYIHTYIHPHVVAGLSAGVLHNHGRPMRVHRPTDAQVAGESRRSPSYIHTLHTYKIW